MSTKYLKRQKRVRKALKKASDLAASRKVPLKALKRMNLSSATTLVAASKLPKIAERRKALLEMTKARNRRTAKRPFTKVR